MARDGSVEHTAAGAGAGDARVGSPPRVAALPRRRRPSMMLVGLVLMVAGAAAGVAWYGAMTDRERVVVAARTVPTGSRIQAGDLGTAVVAAGAGVRTIPAGRSSALVGRVAAVELRPGSLLSPSQVTSQVPPAAGEQLVALALPRGQVPARGLRAGMPVALVHTPPQETAGGATTATQPPPQGGASAAGQVAARVLRVGRAGQDGTRVVGVIVAERDGARVARWAAADAVALVVTHRGS